MPCIVMHELYYVISYNNLPQYIVTIDQDLRSRGVSSGGLRGLEHPP